VEKMRFNDPGMDGGALASEFHLGLSSSATSPAVSLHYDDVRVRFDMP